MKEPVKISILGCGAIAPSYLDNLCGSLSNTVEVVACADVRRELSEKLSKSYSIAKVLEPDELLNDPEIELVVNLTPAKIHYRTSIEVLKSGKHLFTEKPLCLDLNEGRELVELAESKGLFLGGAADTFLGAGFQKALEIVSSPKFGTPVAASAVIGLGMYGSSRYQNVYQGVLLDLGPYYLTALVQLFGSVVSVTGLADTRFPERVDADSGESFVLTRPGSVTACLQFESGPVVSLLATTDSPGYFPKVEVFGQKEKLVLSDVNMYSQSMEHHSADGLKVIEPTEEDGFCKEGRGLGVAEMAVALRAARQPRANGKLLFHVLEVMLAIYDAAELKRAVDIESRVNCAEPFDRTSLGF